MAKAPIILQNTQLAQIEAQWEQGMTPQKKADYLKVVVAGQAVALDKGPDGGLAKLRYSKQPIVDCARGAVHLCALMRKQHPDMPVDAMIRGSLTLMLEGLDFCDRVGIVKVGSAEIGQAMHIWSNAALNVSGITPPVLQKMGTAVHTVMQDPTKMEMIKRRAGVVRDPRASTPTPMVGGDESESTPQPPMNRAARRKAAAMTRQ